MRIFGYMLFVLALAPYAILIRKIGQLVAESRQLNSGVRFNLWWWTPAWKVHRNAFPESKIRQQILAGFASTFAFMMAGLACIGIATYRLLPK